MIKKMNLNVRYFDKEYLDFHHPKQDNKELYQLSYDDGSYEEDQDGLSGKNEFMISQNSNYHGALLDLFGFLKESENYSFRINWDHCSKPNLDKVQKRLLEEIIQLHNDFIMPKRRTRRDLD